MFTLRASAFFRALLSTSPLVLSAVAVAAADLDNQLRIQPYAGNPRYWQYLGEPVLLLGGSKDDNLFQVPDLEEHLDELKIAGGNVIRNTMSDRQDFDFEIYPFHRRDDGNYDLERWNPEYWNRFERLLRLTHEREIIVQIEVWDRFDYSRENWRTHPYNPVNNVNYSSKQSGLAASYPVPPWRDRQPFFHTVPGMPNYQPSLDTVRRHQERFVAKLLSCSLDYGNVLYCMNNETSTPVEWGLHWMRFIQSTAKKSGVAVWVTDMFDDGWRPMQSDKLRFAFAHPEEYTFLDISQVNSRTFNEDHWNNVYWLTRQVAPSPRPMNHTKIYSDGNYQFGTGTPVDGVERFWRNLIAGSASCRFHRPDAGIGLNDTAKACIGAARKVSSIVSFWSVAPRPDLLSDREPDEAYLAADPGRQYILFLTDGGTARLDLKNHAGAFALKWVNISKGDWGKSGVLDGGDAVTIEAPGKGPWVAVLHRPR
jgi:hypothetical protein